MASPLLELTRRRHALDGVVKRLDASAKKAAKRGVEKAAVKVKGAQLALLRDVAAQQLVKRYAVSPLDFFMSVLNDAAADWDDRKWAAHEAAPYVHSKLQSTVIRSDPDDPFTFTLQFAAADELKRAVRGDGD